MNSGGIRSGIAKGPITVESVITANPFGSVMFQSPIPGSEIFDMLEGVITGKRVDSGKDVSSTIQVSGFRYTYDSSKINPITDTHIVKAEIQGADKKWYPISKTKTYSIVSIDFVLNGGDNLFIQNDERPRVNHGMLECGLMDYIKAVGCISPYVDGRIQDLAPGKGTGSTSLEGQWVSRLEQQYFVWPVGAPHYLRMQCPGGMEEMLADYRCLRGEEL
jgi:2',3'-cyclic-nucleotide 2'-phosphodiesterase/3'-nucleotidase/5'-nucleotidase